MGFAFWFLVISVVLCVLVNLVAFFAEKAQKKKIINFVKDNK